MTSIADRRAAFRALHERGCFLLPNPWDPGSARYLEHLGFAALATTSSGAAWSRGRPDGSATRDEALEHLADIVAATGLPVNADFENGYGDTADEVAASVALAVETGVAGLSVEDALGGEPYALDVAVERISAAREAIDASGHDVLLVGRAEGFIIGRPDLAEVVARLRAYAAAGADCLYAPGVGDPAAIRAIVEAVAPKPVNVLVGGPSPVTVADLAALGVRRISVGGALARSAWGGFERAAAGLVEGRFDGFDGSAAGADLNALFRNGPEADQQR
ncbi:isocitrate lyase/phosphoenolpyruvate mutase family protein [Nocardioides carbamazepini]|uniref:isocitrate lyase/PEP mutase family protein n=1 Tax=Nocardioides carbamazepini TaxID=2854259 RepID=UPI00214A4E18|nr:isocitrate lyase/phosphoenolpyruvate mutase family protein [Nocardioides carbamazepini]MCR1784056.1 isocitrate lyase/phosphoenolpyruvate mutase family protein [Nocardioides carbamazepini]